VDVVKSGILPGKNVLITCSFLLIGAASMIIQAIMVREFLVVLYGNELSMGMVLGLWLLSIACGALIYGRIERHLQTSSWIFAALLPVLGFLPLLELFLVRATRIVLAVPSGMFIPFLSMILWTALATLPYGFVVGFLFPLGCRLADEGGFKLDTVSKLYAIESLGALCGGALFSFVIVGRLTPLFILWGIFMATLLFSLILSFSWGPQKGLRVPVGVILLCSLAFLPTLAAAEKAMLEMRWHSLAGGLPLVSSYDSRYENLALTRQEDQFSIYGNGQYVFSFPDPYQNKMVAGLIMSQHQRPASMLIIGATSGGFLKECLDHGLSSLCYVLLDRAMIDLVKPFADDYERQGYLSRRVTIVLSDGRSWLRGARERYDVIFCALPDPSSSMINRFYTVEFFASLRKILTPGGILAMAVTSSPNYLGGEMADYNASLYRTLREVFPHILISPGDMTYFFASTSPASLSDNPVILEKRLRERGFSEGQFPAGLFVDYFNRGRIDYALRAFKARKAGLNSDLRPVTYYYNLMVWDRVSGSRMAPYLRAIGGIRLSTLAWCAFFFFLLRLFFIKVGRISASKQKGFTMRVAVGVFGFSAMALEVVLIFAYQNLFGYLYRMIGLLVASFMGGMTAGSLIAGLLLRKNEARTAHLIALQFMLLLFSLLLPHFIASFSGPLAAVFSGASLEMLFFASMALMGLANGAGFPLACHLGAQEGEDRGKIVGILNAADHLGAALGGFLCGTFMVPLLGTAYTCYAAAILAFMAIALWIPLLFSPVSSAPRASLP
jgi:predicted membrane-bound spermidine synthase